MTRSLAPPPTHRPPSVAGAALGRPAAEALCARLRRLQCRQAASDAAALASRRLGSAGSNAPPTPPPPRRAAGRRRGGACLGSAARGVTLVSDLRTAAVGDALALRCVMERTQRRIARALEAGRGACAHRPDQPGAPPGRCAGLTLHSGLAFGGATAALALPGASVQLEESPRPRCRRRRRHTARRRRGRRRRRTGGSARAGRRRHAPPTTATRRPRGRRRRVDPYAADVWSLGVLLLRLRLAGAPTAELERGEGLPERGLRRVGGRRRPDAPMVALLRAMLGPAPALRPSVARLGLHPCWRGADAPRRSSADARSAARRARGPPTTATAARLGGRPTTTTTPSPRRPASAAAAAAAPVVALHDALWECAAEAAAGGPPLRPRLCEGASPPTFSPLPPPPPPTNSSARCAALAPPAEPLLAPPWTRWRPTAPRAAAGAL